ncbi:FAD dependent oxidoreductase [Colletotrichum musicola]|uniref:FAD dependent oxidoreductase n=1 Tax=Colletotrichum musicola TaxID=2175873 RepID=A0A8H6NWL0_9PEZI|nr:FAD dependent oxidoreductase [Colletotrichum musicola]
MDERARIPVTPPVPSPTPSYWHDPPSRLAAHTSGTLPSTTDTLIIGSGITGAAVAHFLLSSACPPDITMLEARTAISGATGRNGAKRGETGRNGGHTKAASYRYFLHHASVLGTQAACTIARLELSNIRAVHAFAAAHVRDAESRPCRTVDAVYDPEQWAAAKEAVRAMRDAMPGEDASDYEFYDAEEMRERFHVRGEGLCGGIGYEAGSISAYRLTSGVLESCLAKGMRLFTQTPALELRKQAGEHRWLVDTPKGTVAARGVVLATNGSKAPSCRCGAR